MHLDFGVRHARVVPSVQKNAQEMVFVTMENVRKYFFFSFFSSSLSFTIGNYLAHVIFICTDIIEKII